MDRNYGITLNSILRMDILHDADLLAGSAGTDRIVTSVSVMVDPNIVSAVTGGEREMLSRRCSLHASTKEEKKSL